MRFFSRLFIILGILLTLSACELLGMGEKVTVEGDPIIADLKVIIGELQGELDKMDEHREKVQKFQKDNQDLETEMKMAIQRELFEQVYWEKKIFDQLALRKVRLNQRIVTLSSRKKKGILTKSSVDKDVKAYFQNKEIHPLKKGWENRFKAAIDI